MHLRTERLEWLTGGSDACRRVEGLPALMHVHLRVAERICMQQVPSFQIRTRITPDVLGFLPLLQHRQEEASRRGQETITQEEKTCDPLCWSHEGEMRPAGSTSMMFLQGVRNNPSPGSSVCSWGVYTASHCIRWACSSAPQPGDYHRAEVAEWAAPAERDGCSRMEPSDESGPSVSIR
ncbi:hypothetical protein EYF80_050308 [Liparis tanakae]|uniref:Uncharacterized protein n=1 Tax=Liparis tanakae TaxID=230148 RepID=A0A4Z2FGL8_9TELE|nr:hypothetical protein EYF80_050308 [Liparis tanakae]